MHPAMQGDGEASCSAPLDDAAVASRLRMARALQMETVQPVRSAPRPSAKAAAKEKPGLKLCAECREPLSGLPLRCAACKSTYYCSQQCQKQAWPEHKNICKAASKPAAKGAVAKAPAAKAPAPEAPSTPQPASASPDGAQVSMQEALAQVLEESANGQEDKLEALFETSVMLFLRGVQTIAV